MTNDSSHLTLSGEQVKAGKSPKDSSLKFIKQFARVYSTFNGVYFTYCILN